MEQVQITQKHQVEALMVVEMLDIVEVLAGGGTDIRIGGTTLNHRLIVAGGGRSEHIGIVQHIKLQVAMVEELTEKMEHHIQQQVLDTKDVVEHRHQGEQQEVEAPQHLMELQEQ